MITGPKCGMIKEKIETLVVNGNKSSEALKGDLITLPLQSSIEVIKYMQ